jgi:hypothetical protein
MGKDAIVLKPKGSGEITIAKGGEQITSNTYGFEVEFCSHRNDVFQFTHLKVAKITIDFRTAKKTYAWTIETDSSDVLEISTDAILFNETAEAYAAKEKLTSFLVESVKSIETEFGFVYSISFRKWILQTELDLGELAKTFYNIDEIPFVTIALSNWEGVRDDLTPANVDDGINIADALISYVENKNTPLLPDVWSEYVKDTKLTRSKKDEDAGYSSQVNMPMTLQGYFLYMIKWKLKYADEHAKNLRKNIESTQDAGRDWRQKGRNWFWMNLLASVCNQFVRQFAGRGTFDIANFAVEDYTLDEIKKIGFIFVAVNKILAGAMGSLSEPYQLKLQEISFRIKDTDAVNSYLKAVLQRSIDRNSDVVQPELTFWLGYHSHLKDLTALWFKAALEDVADKENLDREFCWGLGSVFRIDVQAGLSIWRGAFDRVRAMSQGLPSEYTKIGEKFRFETLGNLLKRIEMVQASLAKSLPEWGILFANNPVANPADRNRFTLPERKDRPFLGYSNEIPWEGRYDTMWPAVWQPCAGGWTYLIEHRFH